MNKRVKIEKLVDLDNYDPIAYYCKGHVDKREFAERVSIYMGIEDNPVREEDVKHLYLRWGVMGAYSAEEKMMIAYDYPEPGPGRFKVTIYDFGW